MNPDSKIKIAISSEFLSAFTRIPKKEQRRVREFIEAFKQDPTASRFNYEKIKGAYDKNIRSVRIDHVYRGIVLKPQSGRVYMLLWVDTHDEAYEWAADKSFNINPYTGSIQVLDISSIEAEKEKKDIDHDNGIFKTYSDKDLLYLGVPEPLLPAIRRIANEDDLDAIEPHLPQEAYEALFMLAAGEEIDIIKADLEQNKRTPVIEKEDFDTALDNLDSQRRFYVVEGELELAEVLNWPLEKWRVFLHPSQRKLVERHFNGSARVLGGAGTGKTVVAMHRAKYLAEQVWKDKNDRILFTTFTRNLASDIAENLKKICSEATLSKIEIVNLDAWVMGFLKRKGYNYRIIYENEQNALWQDIANEMPQDSGYSLSFIKREWQQVIQPNGIFKPTDYFHTPRIGRRTRLSRSERKNIWPLFVSYRSLLDHHGYKEPADAMRDARIILEQEGDILAYRSIIIDESQDMDKEAFKLIRQMIPCTIERPNDLFIVGDAHQRIYARKVVLKHCGINIMGRGHKLRINYRTTEETRKWADKLLTGISFDDLDGNEDKQVIYRSLLHGPEPSIKHFSSFGVEIKYIIQHVKSILETGENSRNICLIARTNEMLKQYEGALKANDIHTFTIRRNYSESDSPPGIRLATMHRVKGLEFNYVIIAAVNDKIIPLLTTGAGELTDVAKAEHEKMERCLLYVAATRAKIELLITSFGNKSRFLE